MTTAEATNVVLHERRGGVLITTLNRPARQNALDHEAALQLAAAVDLLDADEDLSVGVLTGAGGAFSIGMDLTTFDGGELPYDVAAQLQRSGEPLSAFEAGRYGLVHMVTASGGALDGALELAGDALKRQDELAARLASSSNRREVRFVQDNLIGIAHADVPTEGAAA
jgi:enoyl-CoA hydratase/carnithine racemase